MKSRDYPLRIYMNKSARQSGRLKVPPSVNHGREPFHPGRAPLY